MEFNDVSYGLSDTMTFTFKYFEHFLQLCESIMHFGKFLRPGPKNTHEPKK